jgi:DNA-binding CsgD family transcriptional regulator
MFRLTVAEAKVATALCAGLSPDDYARENELSSNTVYTHIRHLKEKTGSGRMAELIRKLNDVQGAVALNSNGSSY